jgi:hypothetical protein
MANTTFTRLTNFETKDGLASGSAAKRVKGTEIEDEFAQVKTVVDVKADINSPALTGTPTVPTASAGTNTTQASNTAFVTTAVANGKVSTALTGTPTAPTASAGTNTTQIATTAYVETAKTATTTAANNYTDTEVSDAKVSPAFTGTPTAPTASSATNNTQIATTAYVTNAISSAPSGYSSVVIDGGSAVYNKTAYINNSGPSGGSDGDVWFEY